MTDAAQVEFYGQLGRAGSKDGAVELRFYPFDFSTEPGARPVLLVRFEDADFDVAVLGALREDELEVDVFPDRAQVHGVYAGTDTILRGTVAFGWVGYDAEDLFGRVRQMEHENTRLNDALTRATTKDRRGQALTAELRRRAEIKSAGSEELKAGQASAVAVLERLRRHFEDED